MIMYTLYPQGYYIPDMVKDTSDMARNTLIYISRYDARHELEWSNPAKVRHCPQCANAIDIAVCKSKAAFQLRSTWSGRSNEHSKLEDIKFCWPKTTLATTMIMRLLSTRVDMVECWHDSFCPCLNPQEIRPNEMTELRGMRLRCKNMARNRIEMSSEVWIFDRCHRFERKKKQRSLGHINDWTKGDGFVD